MSQSDGHGRSVKPDLTIADMAAARLQVRASTGTGDTFAVFRQKKRAVAGTLDQSAGAVEKLIGDPLQGDTAMGAAVDVNVGTVALAYHHQHFAIAFHSQTAGVGELVETTQGGGQKIIIVSHGSIISAGACRCQSRRLLRPCRLSVKR